MKKKLVIFDCFGVIFDEVAPIFFKDHFDEETAARLKDKFFIPADLGEVTLDELFQNMSEELGIKKDYISSQWYERAKVREYMIGAVEKIREKADVALLSNAPLGFVEEIFEKNKLTRLFDKMFVSSALKMAKPDPAFYLHCVESFGKDYDEIYMIDDNWSNLKNLREIGIVPILFESEESLKEINL